MNTTRDPQPSFPKRPANAPYVIDEMIDRIILARGKEDPREALRYVLAILGERETRALVKQAERGI